MTTIKMMSVPQQQQQQQLPRLLRAGGGGTGRIGFCVLLLILASTTTTTVLAGTNPEGLKFLEENAQKESVNSLPSGLQYKILKKGTGTDHPTVDAPCLCHYQGTLTDGTVFDSSYERGSPTTFAPNQVIKGWTEAMQLMVEGDKWELYIPSELGYGDRGSPPKIKGGDVLIFQMEMLEIQGGKRVPALKCDAVTKEQCSDPEKTYIDKVQAWDNPDKVASEHKRLQSFLTTKMNLKLIQWIKRRVHILAQLKTTTGGKTAEL